MSLLIRNVEILGRAAGVPQRGDVFISGSRISAIGNFPHKKAGEIIDGQGMYLGPGFIDVHPHADHLYALVHEPAQKMLLGQGITTIIGGQDGLSLAPLIYGSLEAMGDWSGIDRNVNWHRLKDLFGILTKRGLGVNFGTLVGYSTIRHDLAGHRPSRLTRSELNVFGNELSRALEDGALGLSMSGSSWVNAEAKFLAEYLGHHQVFDLSVAYDEEEALPEFLELVRKTSFLPVVSLPAPRRSETEAFKRNMQRLSAVAHAEHLHLEISPTGLEIRPLLSFLPLWLRTKAREEIVASLRDEWQRSKILPQLPEFSSGDTYIFQSPGQEALTGMSLRDFMTSLEIEDEREAILRLMLITDLRALLMFEDINSDLLFRGAIHPLSVPGLRSLSVETEHRPKIMHAAISESAAMRFLNMAKDTKAISLNTAVHKITALPAKVYGLKDRGVIGEGNFADLVGFKDGQVKFTIVNGKTAFKDGDFGNVSAGEIIRG